MNKSQLLKILNAAFKRYEEHVEYVYESEGDADTEEHNAEIEKLRKEILTEVGKAHRIIRRMIKYVTEGDGPIPPQLWDRGVAEKHSMKKGWRNE